MTTIVHLAQAWLEHCRDEADYFFSNGEDDEGQQWMSSAEEAEGIIKNFIDTT